MGKELITRREREVLILLARGFSTKEIADRLCISVHTVENHRRNLMEKMQARNVASLLVYSIKSGILSVDDV